MDHVQSNRIYVALSFLFITVYPFLVLERLVSDEPEFRVGTVNDRYNEVSNVVMKHGEK